MKDRVSASPAYHCICWRHCLLTDRPRLSRRLESQLQHHSLHADRVSEGTGINSEIQYNGTRFAPKTSEMANITNESWSLVAICNRCGDRTVLFRNVPERLSHISGNYVTTCAQCGHTGSFVVDRQPDKIDEKKTIGRGIQAANRD